ncbi:hypothetical protein pb186bvf_008550 [Paramecium bursaria]
MRCQTMEIPFFKNNSSQEVFLNLIMCFLSQFDFSEAEAYKFTDVLKDYYIDL